MAGCVCLVVLKDGQRKKVSLPNGAYGELMDALASLTNIHDKTLIQMYDEELDDYVDLEEGSDVPNKAKIKLARKQGLHVDGASPALTFVQSAGGAVEMAEQSAVTENAQNVQSIQSVPLEKERDFLDFVLPSFGHYDEVLRRKIQINGAVHRAIVDKLFAAYIKIAC
ncbi:uncharacterized protein LOC119379600 [Rhipicephalus sanguineus]|uniref:uncharacterized protein LOC119379600 n=1 Tax=Rhipicephalus sanguineus TaxID=34632 RepID=UPI001893AE67|nr:uncharacterized protein LOC119379600 [Rhipicephalus sanguineus]